MGANLYIFIKVHDFNCIHTKLEMGPAHWARRNFNWACEILKCSRRNIVKTGRSKGGGPSYFIQSNLLSVLHSFEHMQPFPSANFYLLTNSFHFSFQTFYLLFIFFSPKINWENSHNQEPEFFFGRFYYKKCVESKLRNKVYYKIKKPKYFNCYIMLLQLCKQVGSIIRLYFKFSVIRGSKKN